MKTVVGIAGGTASGKSTFTDLLVDALGDVKIGVIHMDSYFKRESERPHVASHLNGKVYVDDNCPDTIDWQGFHRDLDGMIAEDNDVIIAEGLLVLWDEHTRDCLDLKYLWIADLTKGLPEGSNEMPSGDRALNR